MIDFENPSEPVTLGQLDDQDPGFLTLGWDPLH